MTVAVDLLRANHRAQHTARLCATADCLLVQRTQTCWNIQSQQSGVLAVNGRHNIDISEC